MSHTMSTWKLPRHMPSITKGIARSPAAKVACRLAAGSGPASMRPQIVRSRPSHVAQPMQYHNTAVTEIGSKANAIQGTSAEGQ